MKKTSKMLGAVALSATLALGMAAPAFATGGDSVDADKNGVLETENTNIDTENNKGKVEEGVGTSSTVVNLSATNTQIKATIPLTIAVYAKTTGGDIMTPREYAYTITNESDNNAKLYLTGVDAQLMGAGTLEGSNVKVPWSAATNATLADAKNGVNKNESSAATPASMTDPTEILAKNKALFGDSVASSSQLTVKPTVGTVYMQMTVGQLSDKYEPAGKQNTNSADTATYDANYGKSYAGGKSYINVNDQNLINLIGEGKYYTEKATDIEVNAKGQTGDKLGIRLEGYSSELNTNNSTGGITPDTMVSLMKVTYTVKASSAYLADFDLHKIPVDDNAQTEFNYAAHVA